MLLHAPDSNSEYNLLQRGYKILKNPHGGGHKTARCLGGSWLYTGDENTARIEQYREWQNVLDQIAKTHDNWT